VTAIGPVHLELLGTIENIVRAKSELVLALPPGGTAVVPAELAVVREDVDVVRVGEDVRLVRCEDGDCDVEWSDGTRVELTLPTTARHHGENAVAALAAYRALGLPLDAVAKAAAAIQFSRWRGDEVPLDGGGLLINDAWNANPPAMRAALEHFVARAGNRRRVVILGDMAELGPDARRYHEEVARLLLDLRIDVLVAVGGLANAYLAGFPTEVWVPDVEGAASVVPDLLLPGDCVLIKGSRAVGLERLAEEIQAVRA
jgi:UDP-N-acetylmuramoyl-tripeptide--D-alanyl-D-alanine ligase